VYDPIGKVSKTWETATESVRVSKNFVSTMGQAIESILARSVQNREKE